MPNTKSAKKSLRQREKRTIENIKTKKELKNIIKKIEVMISEKKTEEAKKILSQAYKAIDKAAKKGIIKKNTASRKKSRMSSLTKKETKK
jgi:small subunit ribosomal protein S20